jgi:hypothetical protein
MAAWFALAITAGNVVAPHDGTTLFLSASPTFRIEHAASDKPLAV